jgi:hypothetical protein
MTQMHRKTMSTEKQEEKLIEKINQLTNEFDETLDATQDALIKQRPMEPSDSKNALKDAQWHRN